jgi:hypothetical protein
VPHPFRFFLRKGWDTNEIRDYTISENALDEFRAKISASRLPASIQGISAQVVALKGHGFSRAAKAALSVRALAPEGWLSCKFILFAGMSK